MQPNIFWLFVYNLAPPFSSPGYQVTAPWLVHSWSDAHRVRRCSVNHDISHLPPQCLSWSWEHELLTPSACFCFKLFIQFWPLILGELVDSPVFVIKQTVMRLLCSLLDLRVYRAIIPNVLSRVRTLFTVPLMNYNLNREYSLGICLGICCFTVG